MIQGVRSVLGQRCQTDSEMLWAVYVNLCFLGFYDLAGGFWRFRGPGGPMGGEFRGIEGEPQRLQGESFRIASYERARGPKIARVDDMRVRHMGFGRLAVVALGMAMAGPMIAAGATQGASKSQPTTSAQSAMSSVAVPEPPASGAVQQAIRRLNHPLLAKRREAIRQLAGWGPVVFPALREAAGGDRLETAISARELLAELQAALFLGAQVRLEVAPRRVAWDEPFELRVRAINPTAGPIRLPWPGPRGAEKAADADALQVAAMLDVADFLTVQGPTGETVTLRVDPIEWNSQVDRAVRVRAGDQPPSQQIPPGRDAVLRIRAFNRGWARYPLFKAGTYRISFAYQPEWKDATWIADGFGRVSSSPATVEIMSAAPSPIQQASRPLEMTLAREGDELLARLVCHWDRRVGVNLNFGPQLDRHARFSWRWVVPDAEQATDWAPEPAAGPMSLDRVHVLEPMAAHILARVSIRTLQGAAPGKARNMNVAARYLNLTTRDRIAEALPEAADLSRLPPNVFTGVVLSPSIQVALPASR